MKILRLHSKIINTLLMVVLAFACNKSDIKPEIPSKYYNIKYTVIIPPDSLFKPFGFRGDEENYKAEWPFWEYIPYEDKDLKDKNKIIKIKFTYRAMHSSFEENLYFLNDEKEIQFNRFNKLKNFWYNGLIGIRTIKDSITSNTSPKKACYYIIWLNKLNNWYYPGDITEYTDTIFTNINKKIVNHYFPKFKGIVVNGNIREIIVRYKYRVDDFRFYYDIKLLGFNRLFEIDTL